MRQDGWFSPSAVNQRGIQPQRDHPIIKRKPSVPASWGHAPLSILILKDRWTCSVAYWVTGMYKLQYMLDHFTVHVFGPRVPLITQFKGFHVWNKTWRPWGGAGRAAAPTVCDHWSDLSVISLHPVVKFLLLVNRRNTAGTALSQCNVLHQESTLLYLTPSGS